MKKKLAHLLKGVLAGLASGLMGAGGGLILVPMLSREGLEQDDALATAMASALVIALVSAFVYMRGIEFIDGWWLLPIGMTLGSMLGAKLMDKLPQKVLRRAFSILIFVSGAQLIFR